MQTKHTPGPWKYEPGTKTIRAMPQNYWLATMDSFDGAVNHDANARLIALAPEMAEVLRECVAAMTHPLPESQDAAQDRVNAKRKARAILNKLEG